MNFEDKTYLVLEMPSAKWVDRILRIREKHEAWRARLPVEVTIIGSSGVGVFFRNQDVAAAINTIDSLAAMQAPPTFKFKGLNSFPESNLYFLEPENRAVFDELQKSIVQTNLKFEASAFPYTPHCTVADFGAVLSQSARQELNSIEIPSEPIVVNALSFYQLKSGKYFLVHQSEFGNQAATDLGVKTV